MANLLISIFILMSLSFTSLAINIRAYEDTDFDMDKAVEIIIQANNAQENFLAKDNTLLRQESDADNNLEFVITDPYENADHSDDFDEKAHERVFAFVQRNFEWLK